MQPAITHAPTSPASPDPDAGPPAASPIAAGSTLRLPAVLDLTWADALHVELQGRIARDGALSIDGSDVERVSTPCVQLLVAAAMGMRANGQPFHMAATSGVLSNAIRDLGLRRYLGMEEG